MPYRRTKDLVTAALIAALITVGAWVALPIGPVPVTLQTFAIVLAALVLPPRQAFAAVGVYILAGAVGVPVFASGRAGLAVIAGPTGGFLAGFLVGAPLAAWARVVFVRRDRCHLFARLGSPRVRARPRSGRRVRGRRGAVRGGRCAQGRRSRGCRRSGQARWRARRPVAGRVTTACQGWRLPWTWT